MFFLHYLQYLQCLGTFVLFSAVFLVNVVVVNGRGGGGSSIGMASE